MKASEINFKQFRKELKKLEDKENKDIWKACQDACKKNTNKGRRNAESRTGKRS